MMPSNFMTRHAMQTARGTGAGALRLLAAAALVAILAGCASLAERAAGEGPEAEAARASLVGKMPEAYHGELARALQEAAANRGEIAAALENAPADHRDSMAFLVANMPERDLTSLTADFLLRNVRAAHEARAATPWGPSLPDDIFRNYVLPYANINERRDDWREDFMTRFLPSALECETPTDVMLRFNKEVFETFGVTYHATKRPKPDQSPYESIEANYASCTGLSIMLVDALRAASVPARVAGIPSWPQSRGNHTWVEYWDEQWYYIGAAEPAPPNHGWFTNQARGAVEDERRHSTYAVSFRRTPVSFPFGWMRGEEYVRAHNTSRYYSSRVPVTLQVVERPGGAPVDAKVLLYWNDETYARVDTADEDPGLELPAGRTYDVIVETADGRKIETTIAPTDEPDQEIAIPLAK